MIMASIHLPGLKCKLIANGRPAFPVDLRFVLSHPKFWCYVKNVPQALREFSSSALSSFLNQQTTV